MFYACFQRLQLDINCLYLEVFTFKLRAAWSDRSGAQKDIKSNLHDFLLYINIIISYSFRVYKNESQQEDGVDERHHLYSSLVSIIQMWWLGTTIHTHSDSEYATQADWVTKSNMSLRSFEYSSSDWLNHTTWFHSNRYITTALPRSMEFESILLHFFTQYRRQYVM